MHSNETDVSRVCACCEHPDRASIEARLVAGRSLRAVAAEFGLKAAAVHRHVQNHLTATLGASAQTHRDALQRVAPNAAADNASSAPRRVLQLDDNTDGLEVVVPSTPTEQSIPAATSHLATTSALALDPYALACELRDSAVSILRHASASGDAKLALDANRAAVGVLDRLARLMPRDSGETSSLPLHASPEWFRLRSVLIAALEPFPQARIAVADALAETGPPR